MSAHSKMFRILCTVLILTQSSLFFARNPATAHAVQLIATADDDQKLVPDTRYVLSRPAGDRAMVTGASSGAGSLQFPTSARFQRTLRHYANPVICDMIFCHTSCTDYDDSCPSFNHHLFSALDEFGSCTSGPKTKMQFLPAADCCVDTLQFPETNPVSGSQLN